MAALATQAWTHTIALLSPVCLSFVHMMVNAGLEFILCKTNPVRQSHLKECEPATDISIGSHRYGHGVCKRPELMHTVACFIQQ